MLVNQQQFIIWHDQHRARLLNRMTCVVRDSDTAEDITAATMASAWRNLDRFRGQSSLFTWVYRIALNEARNHLRRNHAVSLESIDRPGSKELTESDMTVAALERAECRSQIRNALRRIPAVYRRTLVDHFVRGYSVKRISRQNRIPLGTVLSRIFAGKRLLRRAWEG